jgi:hypothetical protein
MPSVILTNGVIDLDEKGDIEADFSAFYKKKRKSYFKTTVSWDVFTHKYKNASPNELRETLIVSPMNAGTKKLIDNLEIVSKKEYCVQLMSIPEYQLC